MVLHNSSYGLISNNIVYDVVGGGIVAEDSSEAYNVIDRNFVVKMKEKGTGGFKQGMAGEAFWIRGPLNSITNNVVANSNRAGFSLFFQSLGPERKPLFRGASHEDDMASFFAFQNTIFGIYR